MSSLQLKLKLLKSLKDGNINESELILEQLSRTTHSHPALYQKFTNFIAEHKHHILQMNREEKEEQQLPPVLVDAQTGEDSWVTDESCTWSEEQQKEEEEEPKRQSRPKIFKSLGNSKSAINLKPIKDGKKHFLVQTKPKQNVAASTINLRRQSSPGSKILNSTNAITSIARVTSKRAARPYFPPITSNKAVLKLN